MWLSRLDMFFQRRMDQDGSEQFHVTFFERALLSITFCMGSRTYSNETVHST